MSGEWAKWKSTSKHHQAESPFSSYTTTPLFFGPVPLFVRVLIQPFLTLTPPSTLPLLLDLAFHLTSWSKWPIRFRHLSVAPRCLACSITLLLISFSIGCLATVELSLLLLLLLLLLMLFHDMLQWSSETFETVPFSHDATPLSSNLIEMKESAKAK